MRAGLDECSQVRRLPEAEALLEGTRSRWAGTQGTWVCLLEGRALPLWDCLIQEGCPTPMGAQGPQRLQESGGSTRRTRSPPAQHWEVIV